MSANVSEDLARAAERHPDRVALIEPRSGREITWAEFDEWVDRVAQTLLSRGLVAGQRVALVMANGIDLCVAYYGVLRGGMVAVPINPRSTPREISRMVSESTPKIIVGDSESIMRVRSADTGDATIVVHRAAPEDGELRFGALLSHAVESSPMAPLDPEALAVVLFTSGATAKPRGVMLSHRSLRANINQLQALVPPALTSDDVVLGLLPMFHIYGLNCVLGQAVRVGARVILVDSFDPEVVLHQIAEYGITDVPLSPVVIHRWVDLPGLPESLTTVRRIVSGATTLEPELAERFRQASGHAVEQGYGLTETAPVITTTFVGDRPDGAGPTPGSVGWALPDIELELRDSLGGRPIPGDPAQIWVRGDNLFSGYWPEGRGGPDEDGWWLTGDLGLIDDDGQLTLVDRMGEMITVSGFRVYPSEIEEVLLELGSVEQAAVVGVPDERTGQAVVAFVVPRDTEADDSVIIAAVTEHAAENLARFKLPSRVVVVDGLPHSPTGKVAKGRLRGLARDMAGGESE